MRLPDHIYNVLKPLMAHHSPWHSARVPANAAMRGPGTTFPDLLALDEVGSGEQFLRFHREMVRVFKRVLTTTPGPAYTYVPWPELPDWVADVFEAKDPGFLDGAYPRIDALAATGTADELGAFIEATFTNDEMYRGVHNSAHGVVDLVERQQLGPNAPELDDARMGFSTTAHHNEHFWGLHGWIDEKFADWQRAHGEQVDQSPLDPDQHTGHGAVHPLMAPLLVPLPPAPLLRPHWEEPNFQPVRPL